MPKWIAQTKGDVNGQSWEISVVREDNTLGQESWGWFDERKLLVSHNGGPCHWPLAPGLGPIMVEIAERLCDYLNRGGKIEDLRSMGASAALMDHQEGRNMVSIDPTKFPVDEAET